MSDIKKVKVLILGSGPAGYTAAIYAARADLRPVMYTGMEMGGQLTTTTEVENYPGFPEMIDGPKLMEDMRKQAERFDTEINFGVATSVDFSKRPFKVIVDESQEVEAEAVIIATGATAQYLGLESETRLKGNGVSGCATCDGFFYKGKDVAVVGGGDTAAEEATYLANLCKKVYMIVRRDEFRASKAMQNRVFKTKNIEILWNTNTMEVLGDKVVNGVLLKNNKTGEESTIKVDGFFLAIGHKPNTSIFKEYLQLDEAGYIKTIPGSSRTQVEGVFASGDVQDKIYRQAVTAAGSGCMAAIDAERWLGDQ
ncbi:MAG: thioredoxin-disulfide reductase [Bacteroidetes bacterium]|nr:thioredoxin-disulfide reductase [Bacteroidota bacterium]